MENFKRKTRWILWVLVLVGLGSGAGKVQATVNWTAYNDCAYEAGQYIGSNVTIFGIGTGAPGASSGSLLDQPTGTDTGVTVTFTEDGGVRTIFGTGGGAECTAGTDAHDTFSVGQIADMPGLIIYGSSNGWWARATFTGLDPSKEYTFVTSANRNNSDYSDRVTRYTIEGADLYTNDSSSGVIVNSPDSVSICTGYNTVNGYVAKWTGIKPGSDGQFAIKTESHGSPYSTRNAYAFSVFMLQEHEEGGPPPNEAPDVEAGNDQAITAPLNLVNLDATVTDDGIADPNGYLALQWSQLTGPGEVSFEPNALIEDPTVRFPVNTYGQYRLVLTATDGLLDANDYVTITVNPPNCPLGDTNGDCRVDAMDLYNLSMLWLTSPGGAADLDNSNFVDMKDYNWLAGNWLENWQAGAVQGTILPAEAATAGGRWRVDQGDWQVSGFVQDPLTPGQYTVEFLAIADWDKPNDQQVQVLHEQTTQVSGTYIQHTGDLQVNISPSEVVTAGAKWDVDWGTQWYDSGQVVEDLSVGQHTVQFLPISGWSTPSSIDVDILKDQVTIESATYIPAPDVFVCINEFMASNSSASGIVDEYGDSDDWIEIYNDSDTATDIGGMYLEDSQNRWQIPSGTGQTSIPAYGFLVLWADGEPGEGPLHLDFQLDSDGDEIKLYNVDGVTLLDSIVFDNQVTDTSYGRYPDADTNWYFFENPSPNATNDSTVFLGLVEDTAFSVNRGFYDTAFDVAITTDTAGATIYYTLDGSDPIDSDGTPSATGVEYTAAIHIDGTSCLRAAAVKSGWLPTNIDAHTYIFIEDVIKQDNQAALDAGLPTVWGPTGNITPDYEMDPDVIGTFDSFGNPNDDDLYGGIYADTIRDDLKSIPTVSIVLNVDDMFGTNGIYSNPTEHGEEWERPTSVELIYPDGSEGFQINCGIQIQGGAFRNWTYTKKKSFRLSFKGIYGSTKLRFPVFGEDATDSFDNITLRGGANDGYSWSAAQYTEQYTRDEFGRRLQLAAGHASSHGMFVHLYINGIYWGLYNPCERPDHAFAASYLGGEKDDWDAIKSNKSDMEVINGEADIVTTLWDPLVALCESAATSNDDFQKIQGNNPDGSRNPAYPILIDLTNYMDYMIVNLGCGNWDWPKKNYYLARLRGPESTGFKFFNWDFENSMGNNLYRSPLDQDVYDHWNSFNPTRFVKMGDPHRHLMQNVEYQIRFADRVHRLCFNDGILTPASMIARYTELSNQMERSIVAESARWGDQSFATPLTLKDWRDDDPNYDDGRAGRGWILNYYLPQRIDIVLDQFRGYDLYPDLDAPVFKINDANRHGGYVEPADSLTMLNPDGVGTIYYTTNGNDPRLFGGALNTAGGAIAYSGAITLNNTTHVKARVRNGSEWSALCEAVFALPDVAQNLRITEIMYHPAGDPNAEFIELVNIHSTNTINLNQVSFTNGVNYTFDDSVALAPGDYVVVYKNEAAFDGRYPGFSGTKVGPYTGSLDNGGEEIDLKDPMGTEIHDFDYSDGWYEITDGLGFSLTIRDPYSADPNDWDRKDGWRASFANGGSPGSDDSAFVLPDNAVVINELLSNSDVEVTDWIELYNTTDSPIDIGGWFLSDSDLNLKKYEIEDNYILPAYGYAVFYEDPNFGNVSDPGTHTAFAFNETGDKAYLTSGLGGEITGVYGTEESFDAAEADVAFGRYIKSVLDGGVNFVAMDTNTPGALNDDPRVGPVVINEIAYHPDTNGDAEYVELWNISGSGVALSVSGNPDASWRFVDDPDSPGLDYRFPSDTSLTLQPGKCILLVKDLTAFTAVFGSPTSDPSLQAVLVWSDVDPGSLSNGGEKLELQMPMSGQPGYYIRVDRVNYDDQSPWPIEPDGSDSYVLERIDSADYGNDVINWQADAPTPGEVNTN